MALQSVPENHDAFLRAAIEGLSPPSGASSSSARFTPDSDDDLDIAGDEHGIQLKPMQPRDDGSIGEDWRRLADGDRHVVAEEDDEAKDSLYSAAEEKALVKKLDRKLVLFLALLYMLSFLDRSNIGNARIAGLESDLHLSSSQYEWLLTAFYVTYIVFEWMTLMYRLLPPHIYISLCVLSWGIIASLQSVVSSFPMLLVLRALLGIGEAAFGPGLPYYLSFFYRRNELALRTGLFISAAPLSISFASTLAWAITALGQYGPIAPWRLLFLVEGFPSCFMAIVAWRFVPDSPKTIYWLDKRERDIASLRLRNEESVRIDSAQRQRHATDPRAKFAGLTKEIIAALKDPKCYLTALMFFSSNVAFSSMPVFEPTIIHSMGYSAISSQALSAPPYLLSFIVVLFTASASDRMLSRSIPLLFHATLSGFGYLFLAVAGWKQWPNTVRYLGLFPACVGFFSCITLIITWTLNNQPSEGRKGTGMAILNIIGQMGPLLGTRLYPKSDGPYYVHGMFVCAAFMGCVGILALSLRLVLARANRIAMTEISKNDNMEPEEEGQRLVGSGSGTSRINEQPFLYIL